MCLFFRALCVLDLDAQSKNVHAVCLVTVHLCHLHYFCFNIFENLIRHLFQEYNDCTLHSKANTLIWVSHIRNQRQTFILFFIWDKSNVQQMSNN